MAKARGARVIGTVSTDEKAEAARAGRGGRGDPLHREDFEAEVKRLTDGGGVDVVYDTVGKTTFEKSLECLRPRGMLVLFGQSSGAVAPVDPQVLNAQGSLFLTRPSLAHYTATRDELLSRADDVLTGWRRASSPAHRPHLRALRRGRGAPRSRAAQDHRQAADYP